jgi:hypothetical protein
MGSMMMIRRVGVLSMAKISGIAGAGLGLVIGVIYGLIFMAIGATALAGRNGPGVGFGIGFGVLMMIMVPVIYGVMGFVFGAIYAVIYNAAAGFVGGIEMELEPMNTSYSTPPPPVQNWAQPPYGQGPTAAGPYDAR